MSSKSDIAVSVRGLSKSYIIAHQGERHVTLAEQLLAKARRPFARAPKETFWALKDVEFDIQKGDVVGIIGRNGAGKSTLLKIVSRITEPTAGQIDLYGRVGSLLEVGTGFHPELTGRENVFLNGAILGMTKAEIRKQFDAIVDFAGVEQFLDTPVKRYSSGMYVRLAFSVAAHLQSEILVVDEVLAVGDHEFQTKCLAKMQSVSDDGRTVLLVSHNMNSIRSLCNCAILLSSGAIECISDPGDACTRYNTTQNKTDGEDLDSNYIGRPIADRIRCKAVRFRSIDGNSIAVAPSGTPFEIEVDYYATESAKGITVGVDIDSLDGHRLATLYSGFRSEEFDIEAGHGRFICTITSLPLFPDRYRLNVMIGRQYDLCDFVRNATTLEIEQRDIFGTGKLPERAHGAVVSGFAWRIA